MWCELNFFYLLLYFSGQIIFEMPYDLQSQVYKIKIFIVRVETLRILYFYYLRRVKIEMNITVTSLLHLTDLVFVGSVY